MMIPIKTKLMIFFMVLILLLSGLAFLLFQNNSRSIEQYNNIFNRFFLLNDIYQKTIEVNSSIQASSFDPKSDAETLQNYYKQAEELSGYREKLLSYSEYDENYLLVKNYSNMIDSFLEQGYLSIQSLNSNNQSFYYDHLTQSGKISRFIQDSTLKLINSELSDYQSFYLSLKNKNENYEKMGVYVFLSAILLCTLFVVSFSEGITRPIRKLSAAARQISRGNFEVQEVIITTKDEMQFLTETFNGMCLNIRGLIQEIKAKSELETLVKKMELRSLQNQMNPHFLFNTLNLVTKTAYVEGAEKTSDLMQSVSALLRYNLQKSHHSVLLQDEVNIVREYFFIQKMRFGNRIRFIERIDAGLLQCPLPSLTIQPLVENAFEHGVESYEHGAEMELAVYGEGQLVIVEIRDNGVGMEAQLIEQLLQDGDDERPLQAIGQRAGSLNESSNGIGLRNVLRRLQLFYQKKDVMQIESAPGEGTVIRLRLPLAIEKEGEKKYA